MRKLPDLNAEANLYGTHRIPKTLDPLDSLFVHFSGYPAPPESSRTVAQLERFYVHGKPGATGDAPADPEHTAYLGEPISGDQTARWAGWRNTGHFPQYQDIPETAPVGVLF